MVGRYSIIMVVANSIIIVLLVSSVSSRVRNHLNKQCRQTDIDRQIDGIVVGDDFLAHFPLIEVVVDIVIVAVERCMYHNKLSIDSQFFKRK